VIVERIPAALAGERLDRVVALIADVSRSAAVAVIEAGGVRVDGDPAPSGKVRLAEGAEVIVDPDALPRREPPAADSRVEFDVVHADDAVIVVDKPAGLVVHPGAGHPGGTLVNGLLHRFPDLATVGDRERPGIVHRLDAGSSGLLVVARTDEATEALIAQFGARTAGRRYDAVVWGHPEAPHGIIDAPIGRDPADPVRMAVVVDGRPARTEYELIERYREPTVLARLRCRLETGRTHQIRVHLATIGHPLLGDATYGPGRPTFGLERPFLHAAELSFDHPATGERLTFTSPLPPDLNEFLSRCVSA
jgi:23S rRNA pseudouridine1911/1915/1917 synthase